MLQANFLQKVAFDTLHTNGFQISIALGPIIDPQDVPMCIRNIEQVLIYLELMLRPWEASKMS